MNTTLKHLMLTLLCITSPAHAMADLAQLYGITWHRNLHHPRRHHSLGSELQSDVLSVGTRWMLNSTASYYQNLDVLTPGLYAQAMLVTYRDDGYPRRMVMDKFDLQLGKDFYRTKTSHAGINIAGVVPGRFSAWAWGIGTTATATPWAQGAQELQVIFAANYRYLSTTRDRRVLLVKDCDNTLDCLIGTIGRRGTQEARNFLCVPVDVRPGDYLNALLGLSYTYSNWTLDAGYEVYAAEAEEISLNEHSWSDDTYGFVSQAYSRRKRHLPFRQIDIAGVSHVGQFINRRDLDTKYAEAPSFALHTLYAGIGYIFNNWKHPLLLKMGGSYSATGSYSYPAAWALFTSVAISF